MGATRLASVVLLCISSLVIPAGSHAATLDGRGYEMISPIDKNGGEVALPGSSLQGDGVFRAAAAGGGVAYPSASSFGGGEGAAPVSQYRAARGSSGWGTANLTPPLLSGTYEGDPFLYVSEDLSRGVLSNGWSCRGDAVSCPAENEPLSPDAPPGYRNLYLHEGSIYTPLLTATNTTPPLTSQDPTAFNLALAGADAEARHPIVATCAALTSDAREIPGGSGCEEGSPNLYEWSSGTLTAINLLPGETETSPGAALAAPEGAVSADGSRVYFTAFEDALLYLREGNSTRLVSGVPGTSFQTASRDGSVAFYVQGGHLFSWSAASGLAEDLTPGGGVTALAAATPDGSYLYYVTSVGLFRRHGTAVTPVVSAAPERLPPSTGRAATTSDGSRFFFTSPDRLVSADTDGRRDAYEWEAAGSGTCAAIAGCIGLLSGGRSGEGVFVDASADGDDAYFLTDASLVASDPGARDLYDARVGGGFPEPEPPIPCNGDDCQGPPEAPHDPTPGTATFEGPANPAATFAKPKRRHHKRHRHRHHRHGKKHRHAKSAKRGNR